MKAGLLRSNKPIKGQYIVVLKPSDGANIRAIANTLAAEHGGAVNATFEHAMQGFSIGMTEDAAQRMSRLPSVAVVEEVGYVDLASPGHDSGAPVRAEAAPPLTSGAATANPFMRRLTTLANNCPFFGPYWACEYPDDLHWALDRIDNAYLIYGYKAYGYVTTGSAVRVYVVDNGVYGSHSEFDSRVEVGANFTINTGDPNLPPDYSYANFPCGHWLINSDGAGVHGTAVASIAAGTTTGIAKEATIVPVKVFPCYTNPDGTTWGRATNLELAQGLEWVVGDMSGRQGRAVVNLSLNTTVDNSMCEGTPCIPAIEYEVNSLLSHNIPVVVAAGNHDRNDCTTLSPSRMGYPSDPSLATIGSLRPITVGGTMARAVDNYVDQRWTCNVGGQDLCGLSYASDPGSNYGECVSVWAPGYDLQLAGGAGPNSYLATLRHGTSFSAPIVTGIVARLLQAHPAWTPYDVWNSLATSAATHSYVQNLDPSGYNNKLVYLPATQ